jgi:uncharacterized protein YecE (DUF72 family)
MKYCRPVAAIFFNWHMMNRSGEIHIGTSNVVVPGNKKTFPPAFQLKSRLHYYSSLFNTVEVNSCFYKIPLLSTFEKWSLDVPEDFRFSLKLSREITHAKDLKGDLGYMKKFLESAEGTGNKKGCLLVQFPGKITLDYFKQVEQIMQELHGYNSFYQWRKAVEFRSPSWYTGETWELLNEYSATMVLHDIPKAKIFDFRGKAAFVYIRFHGPKGDYRDSYTDNFLRTRAEDIKQWLIEGKDVYVYFNNTIGSAFENALSLKALLS